MVVRFVATRLLPAAATLGVAVTVYSSPASAFFPPILGSDPPAVVVTPPPPNPINPQPPVNPPVSPPPVVVVPPPPVPVVPPPPFVPPPPPPRVPPPPVIPNDHCPDPHEVPEPGTIALALAGLGVAGAAGARKVLKKKKDEKK